MYKYIDVGEKDEENPLIWDQINPTKHNKWSGYENYAEVIQKVEIGFLKTQNF